jgi:hypothetical protein
MEVAVTVWGVGPRIQDGRPVVTALELRGTMKSPEPGRALIHKAESGDTARALLLLATFLEAELQKTQPRVVVVRAMDWAPNRKESVVRPRLQVEGVVIATARRVVENVTVLSGKAIGELLGLSKADAELRAKQVLPNQDPGAALAGLAALVLNERK